MGELLKLKRKEVNEVRRRNILKAAKTVEIVPGEMSDMDISMISLVRKGANKQKIQIYKEDECEDSEDSEADEVKGLIGVLKSYFSGKVQKADEAAKKPKKTFAGMMAVNDITENMWRANDTLRSVMRDIINNEEVSDKKAALLQAVDEYSAYMKSKVNTAAIAKGDSFFDVPETEIQKAGKKVSGKNLEALKAAQRALSAVISEAEPEPEPSEKDKDNHGEKEAEEVKKEELTEVMKQAMEAALKPINDRLDKIEKEDSASEQEETEEGEDKTEDITEIIKSVIGEALSPLESRLEKVEKSRGMARSLEGEEKAGRIEKEAEDVFDGYFA